MFLEVKDVRVHYNKSEALKGVSLVVESAEIVCLLGANGAGKTTLLKVISGLKSLSSGEVWYKGERVDRTSSTERVRRGIAQVPEGRRMFPELSVGDNLVLGAYVRNDRAGVTADIEEMFQHFPRLKERRRQAAGSLSGGEQQMVAIARALMSRPKLLLMDEPTHGLSPLLVQEVAHIIQDISKTGVAIVLVEQNANMALRLARRAYVMETGMITLAGDAKELAQDARVREAYLGG